MLKKNSFALFALFAFPSFCQTPEDSAQAKIEGSAKFAQADFKGAESAFRYAAIRAPSDRDARIGLALSLEAQEKYPEAFTTWTALDAEANSQDPVVLYQLGRNSLLQSDFVRAEKTWVRLAQLLAAPKNEQETTLLRLSTLMLAVAQHLKRDYGGSNANLSFLQDQELYTTGLTRYLAGMNCSGMKRADCALENLRAALKFDSTQQEARRLAADINAGLADFDNAYLFARTYLAAEQDPDYQIKFKEFAAKATKPPDLLLAAKESGFQTAWPKSIARAPSVRGPTLAVGLYTDAKGNIPLMSEVSLMASAPFTISLLEEGALTKGKTEEVWRFLFISSPTAMIVILQGNQEWRVAKPLVLKPDTNLGNFLLKNARPIGMPEALRQDLQIRGNLLILPTPEGYHLINELGLEEYLLGVLPAEIGSDSPKEAQRAQAVLARSYGLWRKNADQIHKKKGDAFDVCDNVHCQVYRGALMESTTATAAVEATAGETLEIADKVFQIWYHASCGGLSADTAQWDQINSPKGGFLLGYDPLRLTRLFEWASFEQALTSATETKRGPWCAERSPRYSWVRFISFEELDRKTRLNYPELGALKAITIEKRGLDGRVKAIRLSGNQSSKIIDEDYPIRLALAPGGLRSALFEMLPISYRGRQSYYLFFGRGYGHGRGVCQVGAIRQGKENIPYQQILKSYYPDAILKKTY